MTVIIQPSASSTHVQELLERVKPRQIEANSAILLPFNEDDSLDMESFAAHVARTAAVGIRPCVNMDTGYVNLLTAEQRLEVLKTTREVMGGKPFIAGAFIEKKSGEPLELYRREVNLIQEFGGIPIIFQCSHLKTLDDDSLIEIYRQIAAECQQLIAFELGEMFASFGQIYSLKVVQGLMEIPQIIGIKHSSLSREQEWARLALRDAVRPDFKIYTGNDLAIDMVMYGSDYLLGLSTFAPEKFAERDRYWANADPRFYELNDLLQYLGFLAFRPPVPGYKHTAAQFLRLQGRLKTAKTHPLSPTRPPTDIPILLNIAESLGLI